MKRKALTRLFAGACTLPAAAARAQTYSVLDLGLPPGEVSFTPQRMDETGRVVGYSYITATGETHAYLWQAGSFTALGSYQGLGRNEPGDIAPDGAIAGSSWSTQGYPAHAWIWKDGAFTNIGTLGGPYANAYAINASGQVTGWASVPSPGNFFAYVYDNGVMKSLGETPGTHSSGGSDIADSGDVLSSTNAYIGSWNKSALGSLREGLHDIGTLGGARCFANRMNNLSHITGFSDTGALESATSFRARAFLWRDNIMTDLGTLPGYPISVGIGLNDLDDVVGLCRVTTDISSPTRAFIWRAGVLTDLNTLLEPGSGWFIPSTVAITNDGRILGTADGAAGRRAVILVPNP